MVCGVRYIVKAPSGRMRQPVFKGFRMDMEPKEILG